MKKKLFAFLMCAALVLSIGAAAYAASDYTMTYKPGTTDAVTGMPQNDSGTGGEPYAVSSAVPQREGYEFVDWTLDYGVSTETSYTVRYLKEGTEEEVAPNKFVTEQKIGAAVTETAVNTEGFQYNLIGEESQTKTLGQNAEENVITFYYAERQPLPPYPGPTIVDYITDEPYIVHHMHQAGLELATEYGTALAGEPLTVYARDDLGYALIGDFEQTCESVPCNHVLEYQEFKMIDEGWYRIIPGNEPNWQVDGLQQNCVVAKKDDLYIIWTRDQLSEEEQIALYESFRDNVYGMSDAEYENCSFMYANGSCLYGVTIMDDYISLDEPDGWSLAIGYYYPSYEKIYEKGGDTLVFYFLYRSAVH